MVGGPSKVCAMVLRAGTAWGGGAKGGICGISLGGFGAFGADDIIGYPIFPSFLLL